MLYTATSATARSQFRSFRRKKQSGVFLSGYRVKAQQFVIVRGTQPVREDIRRLGLKLSILAETCFVPHHCGCTDTRVTQRYAHWQTAVFPEFGVSVFLSLSYCMIRHNNFTSDAVLLGTQTGKQTNTSSYL